MRCSSPPWRGEPRALSDLLDMGGGADARRRTAPGESPRPTWPASRTITAHSSGGVATIYETDTHIFVHANTTRMLADG